MQSKFNRYLVFGLHDHDAIGGFGDYISSKNTQNEAEALVGAGNFDAYQIVDIVEKRVLDISVTYNFALRKKDETIAVKIGQWTE